MKRKNEELDFAVAELKRHNIKFETRETNGGHIEIRWQVTPDKEVRKVFTSKTPSDYLTRMNARSVIRNTLRHDGVALERKPTEKKPKLLEKALQPPQPVETIPDQLQGIRSELADITDLLLDLSNVLGALRGILPVQTPPVAAALVPVLEVPPSPKASVRSKKAIQVVSTNWNSVEAIARDLELPVNVTYRKLYYLKQQDKVEFRDGQCRLKPAKLQLVADA